MSYYERQMKYLMRSYCDKIDADYISAYKDNVIIDYNGNYRDFRINDIREYFEV